MKGNSPLFGPKRRPPLPKDISESQKNRIESGYRKIDDHLKEKDIIGAIRDINGDPIINENGIPFQHLKEVDDAIKGLIKERNSLIKSIDNPKLSPEVRKSIIDAIKEFEIQIDNWNKIKKGIN